MNERLVFSYLLIGVALSLLHTSLGATPQLLVTYSPNGRDDQVSLECRNQSSGLIVSGATFTFKAEPGTERMEDNDVQVPAEVRSYTFTIHPDNESLVTCTIGSRESDPVMVGAIPRYTAGVTAIKQYMYSDSAFVEIECPFQIGRLRELYEFSWDGVIGPGDVQPITNGTVGVYWLDEEDNRILHVDISAATLMEFQCVGEVRTCQTSNECEPMERNSPTIMITPTEGDAADLPMITDDPNNTTVDENNVAIFNCTVTGRGDLTIEWIVGDKRYDMKNCSSSEICNRIDVTGNTDGSVTSTLNITASPVIDSVTCVMKQNLSSSTISFGQPMVGVESRPPPIRTLRSEPAQLTVIPAPTTTQPETTQPETSSEGDPSSTASRGSEATVSQETIIILAIVLVFIIVVIIILALCICWIFRYHYKNKSSRLGDRLRRTFSRDPEAVLQRFRTRDPSPRQFDLEIQGTDTPPITYTQAPDSAYVANGNNFLTLNGEQQQIYNTSQISGASGASSYSGLSGVSQNNGQQHKMPQFGDQAHLGVPAGSNYPDHHSMNSRRTSDTSVSIHSGYSNGQPVLYYPTALHSSHNVINQQPRGGHPDSASLPGFQCIHPSLPHIQQQQPVDPLSSLPIIPHPNGTFTVYPQHAASQPIQPLGSERAHSTLSSHSGHSHKSSGRQSPASTHSQHIPLPTTHVQLIPVYSAPQSHFISPNDLASVQFALMHNRHCRIPGCCCHQVRELLEGNRGKMPYDSPEMSVTSSGSERSSRVHRISHQASSTDSDSDYNSYTDKRSRPLNLRLLSEEHNRNPNLHPHYHLTTKSHMRRVSVHAPVDHRRSKSLSDLTPLTEVPETPAKTPAIGGSVKAGTPVYYCHPTVGEDGQEMPTSPDDCHYTNQPMLLREISISADNIPALCLNDCPFTPSPLKEGCRMLAATPGRRSFRRGSMRSTKPKLKTVKEKSSSGESDDSNTSSRSNTPVKSSQSDDEGIDVQSHHSQEHKSSLQKHTNTSTSTNNKAPVDTVHQTHIDSTPKKSSSLGIESSQYDRSSDDEVKEIMQSAPARDIQKTAPSHSPLLGRKRNETANSGYLLSNGNAMSDPRMRRSISPLSVGSSSQVSVHSRRSASPYETEVRRQNGVVTETTEC